MIKVLAIDDEPLALKQLTTYIQKIPFLELAGECQNAVDAIKFLNKEHVDAIFCDINMPDLNGMDFVKSLAAPPIIVFTTAYSEYAVDGYKVDAVDYILKPYGLDDFTRAANKVKKVFDTINLAGNNENTTENEMETSDDTLFVKTEHRIVKISIADITFIEGMSEYLKIHLDGQKPIVILQSLKQMQERLPENFMRIHKSYIVNLKKIQEVNKNRVIMDEDAYLPIGDMYRDTFMKYLQDRFFGK